MWRIGKWKHLLHFFKFVDCIICVRESRGDFKHCAQFFLLPSCEVVKRGCLTI